MKKFYLVSLITFMIDRIIKILVVLLNIDNVTIINNFFNINLAYNYGAAWSILTGKKIFLILISIIIVIGIYFILIRGKKLKTYESITYGLLIGGILGNLFDRIIYGYVIDFLDFYIFGYDFPIFNLADSFIVISIFMLLVDLIRGEA